MSDKTSEDKSTSMGYGDFIRFSRLAREHFGLNFTDKRRGEMDWAIRQAFAASTCASLDEYYDLLQDPARRTPELDRLANALTVNETYFFRDAGQFNALHGHVLPEIIERRRPLHTLRIWSAGCSSGEEPYSIAMLLRDLIKDIDDWSITILASDVNTVSLDRARKAVYGEWAFREERARQWRSRFFKQVDQRHCQLIPEVQRMVTFTRLNLSEAGFPSYETNTMFMDLVLCRNVTIYFPEDVTRQLVGRFYQTLVDGGWLVIGHSEHAMGMYQQFQVRNFPDAILYQRLASTRTPTAWPDPALTAQLQTGAVASLPGDRVAARLAGGASISSKPAPVPAPRSAEAPASPASPRTPPPDITPEMLEKAQALLDDGSSQEAIDLLLPAMDKKLPDACACTLLGQAYANLSSWNEAEQWCSRAIKSERLNRRAYFILALVHQHEGHLSQAIEAMKKVIYIDASSILGHYHLANLYNASGQQSLAQKSLDNARRLLANLPAEEIIPESGGVTSGRLLDAVTRQQQLWSALPAPSRP